MDGEVALHPTFAASLGFHSEIGSLSLSAGTVPARDSLPSRPATAQDLFLFGSGTKPLTATAVLRLAEAGQLSLDDAAAKHVDRVLEAANGTSLAALFGTEANSITVRQLLSMSSGLPDFDIPSLDAAILRTGNASWPPYAVLHAASANSLRRLDFTPGNTTEYSSTNYIVAGLVLLAHQPSAKNDWTRLDMRTLVFPPELHDKYRNVHFLNDETISSVLTVPGASSMIPNTTTTIWDQKAGLLGWTCGNMVASAADVAAFYHDLLVEKRLLSAPSLAVMETFRVLGVGWAKGRLLYGAGLMVETSSYHTAHGPANFSLWGSYLGHGGDTYGFLSEQGIVGQLGNASFSVVSNQDGDGRFVQAAIVCRMIQAAATILNNATIDLKCLT